ncbi:hypothetical protein PoB_004601700 [Plakobranchus ocellatus]|uniref:Uncharacterized protein n=1 Tax=Plakobranchus ocellatus TaxID=259542 RepID=A0AAV4BJD9_9GAST|nr:hypothetical protein PoB_004601700 [Plakobranchus ocellatus]
MDASECYQDSYKAFKAAHPSLKSSEILEERRTPEDVAMLPSKLGATNPYPARRRVADRETAPRYGG